MASSTFDSFVSMTFTELKVSSLVEKIVNISKALKGMIDQFEGVIPFWGIVSGILDFVLSLMTFFLWVCANPLQILIEAQDVEGNTTYFIITDKRGTFARTVGCGVGTRLELAPLDEQDKPIMTTKTVKVGACPGLLCCLCLRVKELNLVGIEKDIKLASHLLFKCCDCSCSYSSAEVTTIKGGTTDYDFVQPCCSLGREGNMVAPKETLESNQLDVKKNKFSCSDFLFETLDLEETLDDTLDDIAEENAIVDAVKTAKELKDAADETKEAFAELKEKGLRKMGATKSVWDITFPAGATDGQKCASVLFVMEQYFDRL